MSGVTKDGILQTDDIGGGGSSTSVAIGQPINATDVAVLNAPAVGTEYGLAVRLVGATGGGGPATIADGEDVNAGATTDAAIITDTTGTLSGKLRGLVKWAFERMPTSLGQKVMAASFPVVISSDQSSISVDIATSAVVLSVIVDTPILSSSTPFALRLDEASATITYVGIATTGTINSDNLWQIKRLDSTAGLVILWADGDADFNNIWDNRAVLAYS